MGGFPSPRSGPKTLESCLIRPLRPSRLEGEFQSLYRSYPSDWVRWGAEDPGVCRNIVIFVLRERSLDQEYKSNIRSRRTLLLEVPKDLGTSIYYEISLLHRSTLFTTISLVRKPLSMT